MIQEKSKALKLITICKMIENFYIVSSGCNNSWITFGIVMIARWLLWFVVENENSLDNKTWIY